MSIEWIVGIACLAIGVWLVAALWSLLEEDDDARD